MLNRTLPARAWAAAMLVAAVFAAGCGRNTPATAPTPVATDFDAIMASGGAFAEVQSRETITASESSTETIEGEVYYCTRTTYDVTRGFETFPQFDPNAEVVYPGNLLQGGSLSLATPSPIPVRRGGGTVVITLLNGSGGVQSTVPEVTLGNITQAANDLIAANTGQLRANATYSMQRVSSREQLGLAINAHYENLTTDVQGSFQYSSDRRMNRCLVKLTQAYYTIVFQLPTRTSQFFAPEVTPSDLRPYVYPGNPAAFISSVTYGRIFYLLVQSTESFQSIEASIDASFEAAISHGSIGEDTKYVGRLENVEVGGYALGGDAQLALAALRGTNVRALDDYITQGGTITTGHPLSYVVRSVTRPDQVVKVSVNTRYDVVDCVPIGQSLPDPVVWYSAQNGVNATAAGGVTSLDNLFANQYGRAVPSLYSPSNIFGHWVRNTLPGATSPNHLISTAYQPLTYADGLQFSAVGMENRDYTLFFVASVINGQPGQGTPANVIWGESRQPGRGLSLTFSGTDSISVSHGGANVLTGRVPGSFLARYRAYTVRFSQTEGMKLYVNGELVASDPDFRQPLLSFVGARFGIFPAVYLPGRPIDNSLRFLEMRVFATAATEAQRGAIEQEIRNRYLF